MPITSQVRGRWRTALEELRATLQERLDPSAPPVRLDMIFTGSDAQKPREGCCIFALSAVKKMASDPAIEVLHRSTLQDLANGTLWPTIARVSAEILLPPSFFKHATSRSVLARYMEARRESVWKQRSFATRPSLSLVAEKLPFAGTPRQDLRPRREGRLVAESVSSLAQTPDIRVAYDPHKSVVPPRPVTRVAGACKRASAPLTPCRAPCRAGGPRCARHRLAARCARTRW